MRYRFRSRRYNARMILSGLIPGSRGKWKWLISAAAILLALAMTPALLAPDATDEARKLDDAHMRGVNFAHVHRRGHGYGSAPAAKTLDRLKALGVEWVALTPFGYLPRIDAAEIVGYPANPGQTGFFEGVDPTLKDADLAKAIKQAHERDMQVLIKPHIWCDAFWEGDDWHGTIDQPNEAKHRRWFRSYRRFILHYAKLAERHDVEVLCIGTELVRMTKRSPGRWRKLAKEVNQHFSGRLTYAAHWQEEMDQIAFWDALDFVGVSAYFPLDAAKSATLAELRRAWKPHRKRLARLHERTGKPIVFVEAGFRSVPGSFRMPWAHDERSQSNQQAQRRAYQAMFQALSDAPWWQGTFVWKVFTDPTKAHRDRDGQGYTFLGKPAARVIDRWYR